LSELRIIVGLGNPGKEYEYTRHNFGFLVIDQLAAQYQLKFSRRAVLNSYTAEGLLEDVECLLVKPLTYMNNSGSVVRQVLNKKGAEASRLLVVCDDFHLDFGKMRIREKGSDGGHNGLTSVIQHLQTQNFSRLRLGIGSPKPSEDVVDYVLGSFSSKEKREMDPFIQQAARCCACWAVEGISKTMSQFNKRKEG